MSQRGKLDSSRDEDLEVGRIFRFIGIILVAGGVVWRTIGIFTGGFDVPGFVLNVAVILLGLFLLYRAKQYIARSRPAEMLDDSRPPVVYLRSFKKDAKTASRVLPAGINPVLALTTFSTFEEQLAEVMHPIGPLVTLANPREGLPAPGAARFHASEEEWRKLVIQLLGRARLVTLSPGQSESLLWEIKTAFEMLSPSKLLLLFHETSRKEYDMLSHSLKQSLGISLPKFGGRNAFIAFGHDWKPCLLPVTAPFFRRSRYKSWKREINHALEPVFRDLGVDWSPTPISALTVIGVIVLVSLFLSWLVFAAIEMYGR